MCRKIALGLWACGNFMVPLGEEQEVQMSLRESDILPTSFPNL